VWRSKERTSRSKPGRRLAISSPMSFKKCLCGSDTANMDGPWAKNGRLVSRPTFRRAERLLGLRQPHPAQQVGVAWVGTQPIPVDVYGKQSHCGGMLSVTCLEQTCPLVLVG